MTRNVLVTVSGILFAAGADGENQSVEVVSPGQYFWKHGRHYVRYDEIAQEDAPPVRNLMKISADELNIHKKGLVEADFSFIVGRHTEAHYLTPYGSMVLGIEASRLDVSEETGLVHVDVEYALDVNEERVSDCFLKIDIKSGEEGKPFSLMS